MSTTIVADANPTKEFFIYMLTKDIALSRAILDLVDNCVDGAIRIKEEKRFDGLFINIMLDKNHFHISDNCGGIDLEIAKKYAFRFGRASDVQAVKHSIGQFGVGMKRALFKIGNIFTVNSKSLSNSFKLTGNVNEWKDKDEWSFKFDEIDEQTHRSPEDTSTTIEITELLESVSESFSLDQYLKELSLEISNAHQNALSKGLNISFNGIPLTFKEFELLNSDVLKPVKIKKEIKVSESITVMITIIAGLGESEPKDAGWYIYCNGRLIINADRTNVTGWGEENGALIPHFHNRSAAFRGYIFFESDNASALPWNTTKTGIDIDSKIYKSIRQDMISVMRPIIDVLNSLSREKDPDAEERVITPIIEEAKKQNIHKLEDNPIFSVSAPPKSKENEIRESTIAYRKDIKIISKVKKCLGVSSNKEVGELTFQYYYDMECK